MNGDRGLGVWQCRQRWFCCVLMAVASLGLAYPLAAAQQVNRPNVVVILADDLGWGDISLHGGATPTPHIDRFFRENVELTTFLVTPLCSPTRAALMTGRHPARVGIAPYVVNPKTPATIRPEEVTLGEAFRAAGYATACFGKWHLGFVYPVQSEGFDEFVGCMAGGVDYFNQGRPSDTSELDWWRNNKPFREQGYTTDLIRDRAVQYIAGTGDHPFFLYVPFTAIHSPLQAPKEYLDRVPASITGEEQRTYSAMISTLDDAVDQILRAIEKKGIAGNTIVFFASDNGGTPKGNNLPFRGHKARLYEGGIRSTTAIRWPARIKGQRKIDQMLVMEDAYPTLLKLADVKRPKGPPLDGKDFASLLLGEPEAKVDRDAQYWIWMTGDAIRTKRWKMIRRVESRELYDMQADPYEKNDVASAHPDIVKDLEKRLDAWAASVPVYSSHVPVPLDSPAQADPSGDVLEVRVTRDAGKANAFYGMMLAHPKLVLLPGDRLEYDMLVAKGSPRAGFFLDATNRPKSRGAFATAHAVDQHGTRISASAGFPQAYGQWARRVTGLANLAPRNFMLRMGFHGRGKAEYRIYLDNIIVRRADGSVVELYRDDPYKRGFKKSKAYPNASVNAVPLAKVQNTIKDL